MSAMKKFRACNALRPRGVEEFGLMSLCNSTRGIRFQRFQSRLRLAPLQCLDNVGIAYSNTRPPHSQPATRSQQAAGRFGRVRRKTDDISVSQQNTAHLAARAVERSFY